MDAGLMMLTGHLIEPSSAKYLDTILPCGCISLLCPATAAEPEFIVQLVS